MAHKRYYLSTVREVHGMTPDEGKTAGLWTEQPYCRECTWMARHLPAENTCFVCGRTMGESARQEAARIRTALLTNWE